MMTLAVRYSCVMCGFTDRVVHVPTRDSSEDVRVWSARTLEFIVQDHYVKNPTCIAKELQDIKIPIENAEWVGGPPIS